MHKKTKIWALLIWLAGAGPLARAGTELSRLSWAPLDFLQKGYRNAPWLKDPFYPEGGVYKLSGVISNEMAYINGKWFHPGDRLDGYTVKSISPQGVTITRNAEIIVLKLNNE